MAFMCAICIAGLLDDRHNFPAFVKSCNAVMLATAVKTQRRASCSDTTVAALVGDISRHGQPPKPPASSPLARKPGAGP